MTVLEEEHARGAWIRSCEDSRFVNFHLHHSSPLSRKLTSDAQGHNFFDPQPVQEGQGSIFLLSKILHDWEDEYCLTILKHLRKAASPRTQLVIIEQLAPHACDEPTTHEIPGAELPVFPKPLLPNLGRATSTPLYDAMVRGVNSILGLLSRLLFTLKMMSFFNGKERTLIQFRDLLKQAGWRLAAIHHNPLSVVGYQKAIAVPN